MSRAGYNDDWPEDNSGWLYRGAVESAMRGRRGQAFLRDLLAALKSLPEKKLIAGNMQRGDCVCAIGAVGKARGINMTEIDKFIEEVEAEETGEDIGGEVAAAFDIAAALAREIMFENDEGRYDETPEQRYGRMVRWVESHIRPEPTL